MRSLKCLGVMGSLLTMLSTLFFSTTGIADPEVEKIVKCLVFLGSHEKSVPFGVPGNPDFGIAIPGLRDKEKGLYIASATGAIEFYSGNKRGCEFAADEIGRKQFLNVIRNEVYFHSSRYKSLLREMETAQGEKKIELKQSVDKYHAAIEGMVAGCKKLRIAGSVEIKQRFTPDAGPWVDEPVERFLDTELMTLNLKDDDFGKGFNKLLEKPKLELDIHNLLDKPQSKGQVPKKK